MGWFGEKITLKEKIAQLTRGANHVRHCYRGNAFRGVLWSVWSVDGENHIFCDVLEYRNGMWWNKPLSEKSGPFYYSCPKIYLEICPEKNSEWRAEVKKYHQDKYDRENCAIDLTC